MGPSRRRRSSSTSSLASTASSTPSPPSRLKPQSSPKPSSSSSPLNVFLCIVAFRLLNALTVRTFFQPDEFFQSLEPAWQIAFGEDKGAWITWEWRHHLRSSLHPLLFAGVYSSADLLARAFDLSPTIRADLLVTAPGLAQAVIAAASDYYTWKLARHVYGNRSHEAWTTLALSLLNPWQWFCSTRTLSNSLETTLTIIALCLWPWEWSQDRSSKSQTKANCEGATVSRLRRSLLLSAFACVLRPTNIIIWISLACVVAYQGTWTHRRVLCREVLLCGPAVLALAAVADRWFYGVWTFPPLRFLYFNIAQRLAVFYGRNDWHYYVSQGFPLLLTTALPFAILGLFRALARPRSPKSSKSHPQIRAQLASICLTMPLFLSLISHKEVRFIYPLLPSLHILGAAPLVTFFRPALATSDRQYTPKRLTLVFILLVNAVIAIYTTLFHASGVLSILSYLREQHEIHGSSGKASAFAVGDSPPISPTGITAGFLMPCHSTPWRSHLVEPTIYAWALSCEPPVDLNEAQKVVYLDEADQFYADPARFLRENMVGGLRHIPRKPSYLSQQAPQKLPTQLYSPHEWPDYLIFFAQLEPTLQNLLRSSSYGECWRTFNTAWHDDWRRKGDIVVWCLDTAEQQAWRSLKRKHELEERDRQFDRIIQAIKEEASSTRKLSPLRQWASSLSHQSWSWPWERRKHVSVLGFQLPDWAASWRLPTWEWPDFGRKRPKVTPNRDLWS